MQDTGIYVKLPPKDGVTYLPCKEQLRLEIERQKELFYLQHPDADSKASDKE